MSIEIIKMYGINKNRVAKTGSLNKEDMNNTKSTIWFPEISGNIDLIQIGKSDIAKQNKNWTKILLASPRMVDGITEANRKTQAKAWIKIIVSECDVSQVPISGSIRILIDDRIVSTAVSVNSW